MTGAALGFVAVLVPPASGYFVVRWLRREARPSRLECAAYGFPLGLVLVATGLLLVGLLGGRYSLPRLVLVLGLLAGGAAVASRGAPPVPPTAGDRRRPSILAVGFIAAELSLILWQIAASPTIADWDGWAIWGFKAKAFFIDRSVAGYASRAAAYAFSWPSRPCLTSLDQAFLYLCLGRVAEGAARFAHVALCVSLLLVFCVDLRRIYERERALLWTAVLVTVPNLTYQSSAGVGNVALGLCLFAALASLERWESGRERKGLMLAAVLLGGACLARDEGCLLALLTALAAFFVRPGGAQTASWRRILSSFVMVVLTSGSVYALWTSQRPAVDWDIRSALLDPNLPVRLFHHRHDVGPILRAIGAELLLPSEQTRSTPVEEWLGIALFWPLVAVATLRMRRLWRTDPMACRCALVAGSGLLAYTAGFLAFPYQDLADIKDNWIYVLDRHMIALVPMGARVMAAAFGAAPVLGRGTSYGAEGG